MITASFLCFGFRKTLSEAAQLKDRFCFHDFLFLSVSFSHDFRSKGNITGRAEHLVRVFIAQSGEWQKLKSLELLSVKFLIQMVALNGTESSLGALPSQNQSITEDVVWVFCNKASFNKKYSIPDKLSQSPACDCSNELYRPKMYFYVFLDRHIIKLKVETTCTNPPCSKTGQIYGFYCSSELKMDLCCQ